MPILSWSRWTKPIGSSDLVVPKWEEVGSEEMECFGGSDRPQRLVKRVEQHVYGTFVEWSEAGDGSTAKAVEFMSMASEKTIEIVREGLEEGGSKPIELSIPGKQETG